MAYLDFIGKVHKAGKRDYRERVLSHNKAECAEVALRYGMEYWDGDRKYGYGGFRYDGRWKPVAEEIAKHYGLKSGQRVLDVGCGKGFLLYELTQVIPGIEIAGVDISEYAIQNAKPEVRGALRLASATRLPFDEASFDFVLSINTLHNLQNYELDQAVREIERVGKAHKYIVVESYRNETEKMNLLYWQLTCRGFYTPEEWEWAFARSGYRGDFGCIFFE